MPSLTTLITTIILPTTTGFTHPTPLTASLSRTHYLPPYGTIRTSIIVSARRSRDDYGGNYWTNPSGMDRYPSSGESLRRSRRNDDVIVEDVTVSGGRDGAPRKEVSGDWWETRRLPQEIDDEYYDDDEYYEDDYEEEYGLPPPSRSRSSFRTGAPPPPRPIRDFYNKLFWFGFDPSTTQPTDRTMFGGTRGKFNALSLLRDRELRQQNGRRSLRGKRSYDPAIQDFGDVREWNERKMGTSPAGGKEVGDDEVVERMEVMNERRWLESEVAGVQEMPPIMDVEFDPVRMEEDREFWEEEKERNRRERRRESERFYEDDDFDFELEDRRSRRGERRRDRRERRRGWDLFSLPESKRKQAEAYDRFIGLGPRDEYDDMDDDYDRPTSRRRAGFAYKFKYDDYDDEEDDDYDDVIDVRPKRSSTRRRSWEERAIEMDRIPPRSVTAWGPNGRADRDAQTMAALEAEREIEKAVKFLEKKEDLVEDAKEEVVSLKIDASYYEKQLEQGDDSKSTKRELGYIIRDVEDASRILRMAKAERDAASNKLDRLKSKHWALLSEYEAVRSFEMD